jgi:hypothetical protein
MHPPIEAVGVNELPVGVDRRRRGRVLGGVRRLPRPDRRATQRIERKQAAVPGGQKEEIPFAAGGRDAAQVGGRPIGDVAAYGYPGSGVALVYNGNFFVFGGTSVSSPIIASVYALASNSQKLNFAEHGYNNTDKLFDVTSGSNGNCSPQYLCNGEVGYDGPTGNGTPNGVGAF